MRARNNGVQWFPGVVYQVNLVVITNQPQRGSPSLRLFPGGQPSRKPTFGSAPGKIVSDFVFRHMAYFKMRAEYRLHMQSRNPTQYA